MQRKIEELNTGRTEASFRFELVDVFSFFQIDKNERYSDRFWCRGLQWSLRVKRNLKLSDRSEQLSLLPWR